MRRTKLGVAAGLFMVLAVAVAWLSRSGAAGPSPVPPPANARAAAPSETARATEAPTSPPPALGPKAYSVPQAAAGEIAGRVVSALTGNGLEGAELTWANERGAFSARSHQQGFFSFRPTEAGRYQLAAAKADGHFPFGPQWGKSTIEVVFRPGQAVRGIQVALHPALELKGRVVDEAQRPVPGAAVRLLMPRKDELALFPTRDAFVSDGQGQFAFRAEAYAVVEAFHPERGSGRSVVEPSATEVVITLEPVAADQRGRASIGGRVVLAGTGVAGAVVNVHSALSAYPRVHGSPEGYRELTDEEGRFEVKELAPGRYDVSAHSLGTAPAHRFDIPAPAAELVLELGQGPKLSGRVTDQQGAAIPSFEVELVWKKAPLELLEVVASSFIDPEGRYAIEGLKPGSYVLRVRSAGWAPTEAAVDLGEAGATHDVQLRQGVTARGTVRAARSAAPIAGARVSQEGTHEFTVSGAQGQFALAGMPAEGFSLQVSAPRFNTLVVGVARTDEPLVIELTEPEPDAGTKTELAGIGAVLRGRNDALVLGEILAQGGAAAAGLHPGDEITAVDEKRVAELGFEGAIRAIRGPVGTSVALKVRVAGKPPEKSLSVRRQKIAH